MTWMSDKYKGAEPRIFIKTGDEIQVIALPAGTDEFAVLSRCDKEYPPIKTRPGASPMSKAPLAADRQDSPLPRDPASSPRSSGVRDTSLSAYRSLERSGQLSKQQLDVLEALGAGEMTRQELADASGIPINSVCGRVHELLQEPFAVLEEQPARRCRVTGKTANPVRRKT